MNKHDRSDKYLKYFLVFAALYFLGHIFVAAVHAQTQPPPPVIQCWSNGFGTIQCAPI